MTSTQPSRATDGAAEPREPVRRRSCVYQHLGRALAIMRAEPDYRKWGPLIEALPAEARDEVREWLRDQARLLQAAERRRDAVPAGTQRSFL